MRAFRSDHRIPAWVAAGSGVRETSRALDSSMEGSYQQSVESKVNEFANRAVGSVSWRFEDEDRWRGRNVNSGRGDHVGAHSMQPTRELTTNLFYDWENKYDRQQNLSTLVS